MKHDSELPPWLIKFAQKITAYFKNSCKKCANFKAHIQKQFEDFVKKNPHPDKDDKQRYKTFLSSNELNTSVAERELLI